MDAFTSGELELLDVSCSGVTSATTDLDLREVTVELAEGDAGRCTFAVLPVELEVDLIRTFDDATQQENYRLVGLPGQVDVDLAETVTGEPGPDWRAFREMGAEELLEYDGTEDFYFRPGRGFWLLAQEGWAFEDTVGKLETATDEPAIELTEGWNVISNPLGTDLTWAEVLEANDLHETLWQWTGSWEEADVLASAIEGEAFYFFNEAELDELSLSTEGDEALVAGAVAEAPEEDSDVEPTRLSVDAYAGENRASGITIGLEPEGGDEVAHRAPPGHFDAASLRIQRPDAEDLLARYITPGEEGVFDLVLEAEPETSVELRLMEISEEADARLELLASGASYDLSETSAVTVDMPDGEDRMQLRLHLASAEGALEEMPEELELQAPYPNPAREEVTVAYSLPEATPMVIEVFNVLGQEVALLEDGERPAGVHEISWSLDTGAGDLPSGTYFVRLRADGYTHTEQFIIVR